MPAAVLAAGALCVVLAGAIGLGRSLREHARDDALTNGRQLAFGISRIAAEDFWRVREEFTFSLTSLPYERLLKEKENAPETLVPVRRFLALNQRTLRELVVIGPDGMGRTMRMSGENYFTASELAPLELPTDTPQAPVISGVVQTTDGAIRARVAAVIEPVRFWRELINTFSISHPDLWLHVLDRNAGTLIVRHGGRQIPAPPEFTPETTDALRADAREGYEGRLLHAVQHNGTEDVFISNYMPIRLESWSGMLMVSSEEATVAGPAGQALGLLAAMAAVLVVILLALFLLLTRHSIRNQRQIDETRRRIEAIFNTVQSGILLVREDTSRIVETNPAALRLVDAPAEEVIGRRVDEYLISTDTSGDMRFAVATEAEARLRDRSGRLRTVLSITDRLEFGGMRYQLCSFVDITPLKETNARLLQSQESLSEANQRLKDAIQEAERSAREAEAANRAKSAFLAMMSHELRTPLNSILGLSESLAERIHGPLTDKQARYVDLVVSSGRHLLDLINDILDLAKIESGQDEIVLAPCQVAEICEAAWQVVQPIATRRRQELRLETPGEPLWVRGDARRLQQILVNLLGNAVKFTPEGGQLGLTITADARAVRLAVWDHGIGISEENLPRLFRPFVQLDSRLARDYAGTGLGLALVKQLVAGHGGCIEVVSQPEKGSTFTVVLPRHHIEPETPKDGAQRAQVVSEAGGGGERAGGKPAPLLVLIAEDNPMNVLPIQDYLESKGCKVEVATNGRLAVYQTIASRPDVVLMDIQMPTMDGLEATRMIRARPEREIAQVPIIALTALAMPGDRERCLAAGADDYVTKPVSPRELHRLLLRRTGKSVDA
ncbi:MAG: ATP-binding protein [Opitutaceae bacterium]|nr:ATP-binding protein [Opitutaceae bacterium]